MNAVELESPTRGHKKRAKTRGQLLDAAIRVYADKGEALTVSDVVEEADVANGTFYNYFDSKQELLDAISTHLAMSLERAVAEETAAEKDPAIRLATATRRFFDRAAQDSTWGWAVVRLGSIRPEIRDQAGTFLLEDLRSGRARGRFDVSDPVTARDLVAGTMLFATRRILEGRGNSGYAAEIIALVLRALGLPAEEARSIAERSAGPSAP